MATFRIVIPVYPGVNLWVLAADGAVEVPVTDQ